MPFPQTIVYVLKSGPDPTRYYTGLTSNLAGRIEAHNAVAKRSSHCLDNASPMIGTPQTKPSAVEMDPTTSDTVRVNQRLAPSRASGHPSRPESAAIPAVDPTPNNNR